MTNITYGETTGDYVDCQVGDVPLRMVFNNFHAYPTTPESLIILKSPPVLERQTDLLTKLAPKSILEFGIFEGGSAILWPRLLNAKYCGVDLRPENPAIRSWIQRFSLSDQVSLNFHVSQSDEEKILDIVNNFFGADGIDLVIDDASHIYQFSRRTFEISFPLLKAGGVYLLEDWPWAHANSDFWQKDKYMGDQPALTNLVFEIVMLFGSCPHLIDRVEIFSNYAVIYKSLHPAGVEPLSFDQKILKQDRVFTPF